MCILLHTDVFFSIQIILFTLHKVRIVSTMPTLFNCDALNSRCECWSRNKSSNACNNKFNVSYFTHALHAVSAPLINPGSVIMASQFCEIEWLPLPISLMIIELSHAASSIAFRMCLPAWHLDDSRTRRISDVPPSDRYWFRSSESLRTRCRTMDRARACSSSVELSSTTYKDSWIFKHDMCRCFYRIFLK